MWRTIHCVVQFGMLLTIFLAAAAKPAKLQTPSTFPAVKKQVQPLFFHLSLLFLLLLSLSSSCIHISSFPPSLLYTVLCSLLPPQKKDKTMPHTPFRRVKEDIQVDPKVANNSFEAKVPTLLVFVLLGNQLLTTPPLSLGWFQGLLGREGKQGLQVH